MKKKLIIFTITILFFGAIATPALANVNLGGSWLQSAGNTAGYGETTDKTLAEIIGTIIKAALSLVGVFFTFLMAWAGNQWMTARGEEEQIKKAQKVITGSVMGLIVTLAAYVISNFAVGAILERATKGTAGQEYELLRSLLGFFG